MAGEEFRGEGMVEKVNGKEGDGEVKEEGGTAAGKGRGAATQTNGRTGHHTVQQGAQGATVVQSSAYFLSNLCQSFLKFHPQV